MAEGQTKTSLQHTETPSYSPSNKDGSLVALRPGSAAAKSSTSTSKEFGPKRLLGRTFSKDPAPSLKSAQDAPQAPFDPLSRRILERTDTQNMTSESPVASSPLDGTPGASEDLSGNTLVNSPTVTSLGRTDSLGKTGSAQKDKKKGVSFLSRIIGAKKKDAFPDIDDSVSENSEARPTGVEAEVFSQPIGFVPRFPPPPRYIKVRSQNTTSREFDRVFLAQIIDEGNALKRRKSIDSRASHVTSSTATSQTGNTHAIWAMEFSKDGKYLAAAGQDKTVRVWSVISTHDDRQAHEKQEENKTEDSQTRLNAPVFKKEPLQEYVGHESSVLDVNWSKNNFLLSSSMDKTVRLWHVTRNECLFMFKHNDFVTSIQFHPRDDRFFLAGSLDSTLRLWSIPDKHVTFSAKVQNMVTAVAFTPDGRYAIAGCYDGICLIYETENLRIHAQIHVRSARGKNAKGSKITGIETITLPKDDPNGEVKMLITSNDSRVRLYNFRDRQLELKFRGNENTCSQIHATFSDDGRYVICGSEDRKVYIWPTAPVEKDLEKRPLHVFEAHSAIVTNAVLAPTRTRMLLGQSGDPIYDLVNPPPVTLVDPTEDSTDSKAATESGRSTRSHPDSDSKVSEKPKRPEETHRDGNIIVTADYTGAIRVFRQDNAYEKRQQLSWDSQSTFSKKILGRSASVATRASRTSVTSSRHRNSISRSSNILSKTNPTNDRILNWRNTVTGDDTASRETLRSRRSENGPTRSISPRKSINGGVANERSSPRGEGERTPSIVAHPAPDAPQESSVDVQAQDQSHLSPERALPVDKQDPLLLIGDESMRFYDTATYEKMARRKPRSPDLLNVDDNPLDRKESVVSQLSSELSSVRAESADDSVGDEEVCKICSGREFRIALQRPPRKDGRSSPVKKLICSNCGAAVS